MGTPPRPAVLVVDNDPTVRELFGKMVERLGYDPLLAGGGEEAVRVQDHHRERIAAVVLDVRMPGLDGPAVLAALRERTPGLPCVFVTSGATGHTRAELTAGGAVLVAKPVRLGELEQALRDVCPPASP